ncbi:lipid-binding protein [Pontibacter pudoricolor]|uniref:lipid-binding protein n=1 Tax=Pontibacter pudoricolor TaxID=2694930 RepID=UPI001391CC2D|nr:lipid-binding protein [Pontibacter pudoricolor]
MKKIYTIALLLTFGFLSSCERDDPEIEMTAIGDMAGEWYVTYMADTVGSDGPVDFGGGHSLLLTYNTSANTTDSMIVDDLENFWEFKTIVNANKAERTFSAPNGDNLYYDSNGVIINNGKIIIGGGESRTGVKTDSIYFEVAFGDDPDGLTYIVSGHRRTGFLEDEF